jgi:hypothetical protein
MLNQALVGEYLSYSETTGELVWLKTRRKKAVKGCKARCLNKASGNVYIRLLGDKFLASHLAFVYMESRLPSRLVYLDGDRTNIAWSNLEGHTTKKMMYCKPWGNVPLPSRYRGLVKGIAEGCYRHKSEVSIDPQGLTQWVARSLPIVCVSRVVSVEFSERGRDQAKPV